MRIYTLICTSMYVHVFECAHMMVGVQVVTLVELNSITDEGIHLWATLDMLPNLHHVSLLPP